MTFCKEGQKLWRCGTAPFVPKGLTNGPLPEGHAGRRSGAASPTWEGWPSAGTS